jgi:high-affinity iron transporter
VDLGSLASGLVTGLREGVEAALIVSIILAYLARTGNRRHFGRIWTGTVGAVLVSIGAGVVLFLTLGELPEPYEQLFEALAMLIAGGVVTWMLFWMRRQAGSVKGELQSRVDRVLTDGTANGLAVLAFTAVIREGLETSLFLFGLTTSAQSDGVDVLVGAVVGLSAAALLGVGFYRGARLINLRVFFRWTGIALIFIAAGLLASAIHELVEIGWIPVGTAVAFDVSSVLPHEAIAGAPGGLPLVIGGFLRALFGYSSRPEVAAIVVWLAYIAVVLRLFLRPMVPRQEPVTSSPGTTPAS